MQTYIRAKQMLKRSYSFKKFQQQLPVQLNDPQYLALLIAAVIEQDKQPFDKYLNLLLIRGADPYYCQLKHKMNLIMFAAQKSHLQTVESLLKIQNLQLAQRDDLGRNILHHAILNNIQSNAIDIIEHIISIFPDILSLGNYPQGNYLFLSIQQQKVNIARLLIQYGVSLNDKNVEGFSLFHQVIRTHKKHRNIQNTQSFISLLFASGAKEDIQNNQQLNYIEYCKKQNIINAEELEQLINISKKSRNEKKTIQTEPSKSSQSKDLIYCFSESDKQIIESSSDSQNENESQVSDECLDHEALSNEMYEIFRLNREDQNICQQNLYFFFHKLQSIAHQLYADIQFIGSFATRLWVPSSDIDILLIFSGYQQIILYEDIIDILHQKIKSIGMHSYIKISTTYKLPLIKINLLKQFGNLQIQIFISNKKSIASKYVNFINSIISYDPQILVIFTTIRKLLATLNLHDHKNGGLKCYALFLMIHSMRNQYSYRYVSQFLEHFCYYYGFQYEYVVECNQKGEIDFKINLADPLNSKNNMGGKNTQVLFLKEVFKKIYYALNTFSSGSKLNYLAEIIKL